MAYREAEVGVLVRMSPAAAADRIVAAYIAENGVERRAAKRLGCGISSLKRWVERLEEGGLKVRARIEVARNVRRAATKERKRAASRERARRMRRATAA